MAVFDANFMVYLFDPEANAPDDPSTGQPVTELKARLDYLVQQLAQSGETIVIPTPALSEYLVGASTAGTQRLQELQRSRNFRVASFDTLAAVELAALTQASLSSQEQNLGINDPKQKVKFDRQIVAIAKVAGETSIYSDDAGLRSFAKSVGLNTIRVAELELPPEEAQRKLDL